MPEINVMAKKKYKQQFTDIFLLLVSIERFVAFEFAPNVGQFFVNTLYLCFLALACEKLQKKIEWMNGVSSCGWKFVLIFIKISYFLLIKCVCYSNASELTNELTNRIAEVSIGKFYEIIFVNFISFFPLYLR